MPRHLAPGLALTLGACGGAVAGAGDEPQACALAPVEAIHAASFTDATTYRYAPDQLVADADYVYFADGRAIHRVPRCGGAAEPLIADARPFNDGLALADGVLYWIAGDDGVVGPRVMKATVDGGDPVVLAEYEGYSHRLRVDGDTVAWNAVVTGFPDESRLHVVGVDGSDPRVLARHRYGWDFDLADGVLYAGGYLPGADPAASDRLLFALPVDGGAPTVLVDDFGDGYPTGIVVAGDHVHYLRAWSTDLQAVERAPRTGGPPHVLDLAGAAVPDRLLVTGDRLYGVDAGGGVARIVDGQAPAPLVTADALAVPGRVFGDVGGLFVGDAAVECVEWFMDPSGEPPGMTCVRETIDVRILWLGR